MQILVADFAYKKVLGRVTMVHILRFQDAMECANCDGDSIQLLLVVKSSVDVISARNPCYLAWFRGSSEMQTNLVLRSSDRLFRSQQR